MNIRLLVILVLLANLLWACGPPPPDEPSQIPNLPQGEQPDIGAPLGAGGVFNETVSFDPTFVDPGIPTLCEDRGIGATLFSIDRTRTPAHSGWECPLEVVNRSDIFCTGRVATDHRSYDVSIAVTCPIDYTDTHYVCARDSADEGWDCQTGEETTANGYVCSSELDWEDFRFIQREATFTEHCTNTFRCDQETAEDVWSCSVIGGLLLECPAELTAEDFGSSLDTLPMQCSPP
jgi:hypothetical protein